MSSFAPLPNLKSPATSLLLFLITLVAAPYTLGQDGSSSGGDPSTSGGGSDAGSSGSGPPPDGPYPLGTPTLVGYWTTAHGMIPMANYTFASLTSDSVFVVPFRFDALGDYTLTSANLLLSTPSGTASLSDVSLQVFSSLPASLSLPTPITSFASLETATTTLDVHTFAATSSPTFTAGTTYYLGLTYFGLDPLTWNATDSSVGAMGAYPVNDTFSNGTAFSYYGIGTQGVNPNTYQIGGFSITAAAVTAIPEPATTVAFAAGAVLAAALWVRWRRRHPARGDEERPPES